MPFWESGVTLEGTRDWTSEAGDWSLEMTDLELRLVDPAPQHGTIALTNPDGNQVEILYARLDTDTIEATLVGLRRGDRVYHITGLGLLKEVMATARSPASADRHSYSEAGTRRIQGSCVYAGLITGAIDLTDSPTVSLENLIVAETGGGTAIASDSWCSGTNIEDLVVSGSLVEVDPNCSGCPSSPIRCSSKTAIAVVRRRRSCCACQTTTGSSTTRSERVLRTATANRPPATATTTPSRATATRSRPPGPGRPIHRPAPVR